jgi:hypothetical protein
LLCEISKLHTNIGQFPNCPIFVKPNVLKYSNRNILIKKK